MFLLTSEGRFIGYLVGALIMLISIIVIWRSFRRRDRCTVRAKAQVVQIREEEVETIDFSKSCM